MQPYSELNAHHIGKSHIQSNQICEDYSSVYSDETMNVIVISDGHGDKNCFRSAIGAKYACETAVESCREFQNIANQIDDIESSDFENLLFSLEADIAEVWKKKVLADAEENPFSDQELSSASEEAQEIYKNGKRLEKAYGCTLIIAMSTDRFWIALQIGDGKCVAAYPDGVYVEPVPVDENCLGNISTSLCNSNASQSFRHYFSKVKPVAVFVSSDGVEESFDQPGLYNCFYSIAYWLKEEGIESAKNKLDDLLPQISEGGSGDDVSVAVMVSKEQTLSKPRQTLDQIYARINTCADALEQCNDRLSDAKDRLSQKQREVMSIENEITELKKKLEEKENLHQKLSEENRDLDKTVSELAQRAQLAAEQMEKVKQYKVSAEKYWFAELEKIGLKNQIVPKEVSEKVAADKEEQNSQASDDQAGDIDNNTETDTDSHKEISDPDSQMHENAENPDAPYEDDQSQIQNEFPDPNEQKHEEKVIIQEKPERKLWVFKKKSK